MGCRDRIIAFPWGNEDTQALIDIFDQYNVKVTFFVVGDWVEKYPESVKALADAGHEVMCHSDSHAHFNSLSADEIVADISSCCDKIEAVTGTRPTLFRPPFGEYDDHVVTTVRGMGLEVIQWDVEPLAAPARPWGTRLFLRSHPKQKDTICIVSFFVQVNMYHIATLFSIPSITSRIFLPHQKFRSWRTRSHPEGGSTTSGAGPFLAPHF